MFKQLIHYKPNVDPNLADPVAVETSGDLQAVQIEEWENQVSAKHVNDLPAERQWGMIDQNHPWFDASKVAIPTIDMGKGGSLLTPEQVLMRERTAEMRARFTAEE